MGGFYLVRHGERSRSVVQAMDASFADQGFAPSIRLETDQASLAFYGKICGTAPSVHRGADGDFCAAAGTLLYKDKTGEPAMAALLADETAGRTDRASLYGHFCVAVACKGRLSLFSDQMGTYPVWRDGAGRLFTSSFLAATAAAGPLSVDPQACWEYVFQGTTYGGASPFREIGLIDCRARTVFEGGTMRVEPTPLALPETVTDAPLDVHAERNVANLRRYYDAIAASFGSRIDTALSGGYDSRLTLALLMERGIEAAVHVYGRASDPDVVVAKRIAAGEGINLVHVDKARAAPAETEDPETLLARNFRAFEGYPVDGLFDNGADLASRLARTGDGRLALNGGGGEIFRNFFYLPDRRYSLREVVWTFYSQYDPQTGGAEFDEDRYVARLVEKLGATLGTAGRALSRLQVERVYPEFRCRFWMGRNNAVNNRLGPALTPFIDANIVPGALAAPLSMKDHGRLEARMIALINPRLAAYPSAYGHAFDSPPPIGRRLKDRATYARPPWLRRYVFRLKTRQPQDRPAWLRPDRVGRLIDLDFPYLRGLFRPEAVHDNAQYNRLCSLEYLFEKTGPNAAEAPHAEAA